MSIKSRVLIATVVGVILLAGAGPWAAQDKPFTGKWFYEGRQGRVGLVRFEIAFKSGNEFEISRLEYVPGHVDMQVIKRASASFQVQPDETIRIPVGEGPTYALKREGAKLLFAFTGPMGPQRPRDQRVAVVWDVVGPVQMVTLGPIAK